MTSVANSVSLPPLPQNPSREAVATIRGYAYQVWISLDEWLRIRDDEIIYLEGAEDLDRVGGTEAVGIQVRDTKAAISLNTKYGRKAILQFWETVSNEKFGRAVRFTYWTRSSVAMEENAEFEGICGIDAWTKAGNDVKIAELLRGYLIKNIGASGSFLEFLQNATAPELQVTLFRPFIWLPNQSDAGAVKEAVLDRLDEKLSSQGLQRSVLAKVRDRLFTYCWEQLCKSELKDRVLTTGALAQEIERATSFDLSLPISTVTGFLAATLQLSSVQKQFMSIQLLVSSIPELPAPVLQRTMLQNEIRGLLSRRDSVFLTGSVYKGKTTIAATIATEVCSAAWWIDLSSRDAGAVRDICNLLSMLVETEQAPDLIVLDDLDTSMLARKSYTQALQKLLYRIGVAQKTLLVTAQGTSPGLALDVRQSFGMTFLEIPGLSVSEIALHSMELACPDSVTAENWAKLIFSQTGGHPRMVYVRLIELAESGWPRITGEDFLKASPGVRNVQQLARALFSESVSGVEADFVYTIAEFSTFPTRETLLNLADDLPSLHSAGDFLDKITGKWLEQISEKRVRVTPMLKVRAGEVWSEKRRFQAHAAIYDAILKTKRKTPEDGAALVFHAFIATSADRLMRAAMQLVMLKDRATQSEVFRNLPWLTAVATTPGIPIVQDTRAAAALRHLQFYVAVAEGNAGVEKIARAWKADISRMPRDELAGFIQLFNLTLMTTPAALPPSLMMDCAVSFNEMHGVEQILLKTSFEELKVKALSEDIPTSASNYQIFLALKANMVACFEDFISLLDWLSDCNDLKLLSEFDAVVGWPLVSTLGAFIHVGWMSETKYEEPNWVRWEEALARAMQLSIAKSLPQFGLEATRASSVIRCEYLHDTEAAIELLNQAKAWFGESTVLLEQLVNIYYQRQDYQSGYDAWLSLLAGFDKKKICDPFAFRRAAMCAVNIGNLKDAAQFFEDGAAVIPSRGALHSRACLLADAALSYSLDGDYERASQLMIRCLDEFPDLENIIASRSWEGAIRMIYGIANQVRGKNAFMLDGSSVTLKPGQASAPGLHAEVLGEKLEMRLDLLKISICAGAMHVRATEKEAVQKISLYCNNSEFLVSSTAYTELLEFLLVRGVDSNYLVHAARISDYFFSARLKSTPERILGKTEKYAVLAGFIVLGSLTYANGIKFSISEFISASKKLELFDIFEVLVEINRGFSMEPMVALKLVANGGSSTLERIGAALGLLHCDKRNASMGHLEKPLPIWHDVVGPFLT